MAVMNEIYVAPVAWLPFPSVQIVQGGAAVPGQRLAPSRGAWAVELCAPTAALGHNFKNQKRSGESTRILDEQNKISFAHFVPTSTDRKIDVSKEALTALNPLLIDLFNDAPAGGDDMDTTGWFYVCEEREAPKAEVGVPQGREHSR